MIEMQNSAIIFYKAVFSIFISVFVLGSCAFQPLEDQSSDSDKDSLFAVQIITDSLFNSRQRINILTLDKISHWRYSIDFAYQTRELLKTSRIAESKGAFAAINGSFFDMDSGGSVTYF